MTPRPSRPDAPADPILVTGGAGFVGTNLVHRLASAGHRVTVYDALARTGVEANLDWLRAEHGDRLTVVRADVRDREKLAEAVAGARTIYHLAAQVAVTTSLIRPVEDFEVNCAATVSLLELARRRPEPPRIVFTSTNKVYGTLDDVGVYAAGRRCEPFDPDLRDRGVPDTRPLDFQSPYGCSKGAADQYVLDYARSYGLPATVLRMSCIYGPFQRGNVDQGWLAHFLIRTMEERTLTIYGDGRQVRDVLYVDDLVDLLEIVGRPGSPLTGRAVNVGGGPQRAVSLLEVLAQIGDLTGRRPDVRFGPPRPGDQRWYVSDPSRITAATGWRPTTGVREGLVRLHAWLKGEILAPPVPAPGGVGR